MLLIDEAAYMADIFVSYTGKDRVWASGIGFELEALVNEQHRGGADRERRTRGCAGPFGPSHVWTCAS